MKLKKILIVAAPTAVIMLGSFLLLRPFKLSSITQRKKEDRRIEKTDKEGRKLVLLNFEEEAIAG